MKTLKMSTLVAFSLLAAVTVTRGQSPAYDPGRPSYYPSVPMSVPICFAQQAQFLSSPGQSNDIALAGCTDSGCAGLGCASAGCGVGGCQSGCSTGGCGLFGRLLDCGSNCGIGCGPIGAGLANCGSRHGPAGSGGCCLPRWFDVQGRRAVLGIAITRSHSRSSSANINGPIVLSTDNLEIEEESGFRITGAYLVGARDSNRGDLLRWFQLGIQRCGERTIRIRSFRC